jgi:hypothetical protein
MQARLEAISTFLVVYDFFVEEISLSKPINPASFLFSGVGGVDRGFSIVT